MPGQIGNLAVLPLKTSVRGPAPSPEDNEAQDIIDEAIALFRANCLFRNYEIYGAADRVLLYLILWISDCLGRIQAKPTWTANEANKQLQSVAVDHFALPGDPGFPMNNMYEKAASKADAGESVLCIWESVSNYKRTRSLRLPSLLPHAMQTRIGNAISCHYLRRWQAVKMVASFYCEFDLTCEFSWEVNS